ncbi:MAG: FkbM family methyltransferase [Chitinophagales bacterium]
MKLINRIKLLLPKRYKRLLQKIYLLPKHGGFAYIPGDSYSSLVKKINRYYTKYPEKKTAFEAEINHLNTLNTDDGYAYVFPYSFVANYNQHSIDVQKDEAVNLFYVLHKGKKLYYNVSYDTIEKVQYAYNCTSIEQDAKSPHCYVNTDFNVPKNAVVLDIGAAEGNFALEIIEDIKHLYLFEPDPKWIPALEATYQPWKEKVTIINKFVSNYNDDNCVSLDVVLKGVQVDFIKMDVEGYERSILDGAQELLKQKGIKLSICTYHHNEDYDLLQQLLEKYHFKCLPSDGYMLLVYAPLTPPFFRKGLLRAQL